MGKKSAVLLTILLIMIQALIFTNLNKLRANDDEILAEINGEKITMSEFKGLAKEMWKNISRKEDKKVFLNEAIEARIVASKAREIGLHNDPDIKEELETIRARQLMFYLRNRIKEQIAEQIAGKDFIPEYGRQKVRFGEIVVQSRPEAEEILRDLLKGANFEKLAQERSINIYSKNGGDIGFVIMGKGTFLEQVENIIFKLANGQISEILKTREGYAIFKAMERKDFTQKDRGELIAALKKKLMREKKRMQRERLRSQAKITIFSDNIKKIQQMEKFAPDDDLLQMELVNVNGTILRLEDLLRASNNKTLNGLKSRDFYNPGVLENMIKPNIEYTLMVNEAVRIGLDNDPKLKKHLKICEDSMLAIKYVEEVLFKEVTCLDEEIKKFYEEYKDGPEYKNMPEYVHARHLVVDDEDLAQEILKQLKDGADFTEMARKYTMGRKKPGFPAGDFGYIKRSGRVEMTEIEKAALFSLSIGEVKMIEMVFPRGNYVLYSIVKAEDKINRGSNGYNEIKGLMKFKLLEKKREEKKADFIAQLRSEADIKIHLL